MQTEHRAASGSEIGSSTEVVPRNVDIPEFIGDADSAERNATTGTSATIDEEHYCFHAKYAKTSIEVRLAVSDAVQDLKAILFSMTDVPPERQKILGLVRGKLPSDDTRLGSLQFPPASLRESPHPVTGEKRISISLLGTPLDQTFQDPTYDDPAVSAPEKAKHEKFGDFDYSDPAQTSKLVIEPYKDPKAVEKLQKAISRFSHTFPIMQQPRPNLKGGLLILDLDYTMADTKRLLNYTSSAREAERPGLHDFLADLYPYYDISVWSATSLMWLEAKLVELGCLTHQHYSISFVMDRTPMFNVRHTLTRAAQPDEAKRKRKHEVKALQIIWERFKGVYGPHNTIHIDDLARNFAMSPNCGLKIKPYRQHGKHESGLNASGRDVELFAVRDYLLKLAHSNVKDFQSLNGHRDWRTSTLPSVWEEEGKFGSITAASTASETMATSTATQSAEDSSVRSVEAQSEDDNGETPSKI